MSAPGNSDVDLSPGAARGAPPAAGPILAARDVRLGYRDRIVADGVDVEIPRGRVTAIIGPNGCGKSTLLRAFGRLLTPRRGRIELDGRDLATIPSREIARRLAILPQEARAPEGLRVRDLIARGRYPHQSFLAQASDADRAAIGRAIATVGLEELAEREVGELSGGQRQRVWIAMTLAQETELLLLDEPTTFLDLAHQIEVLGLVDRLHRDLGRTVVLVLHDLGQAARYADHVIVMRDGAVVTAGAPSEVIDADLVEEVFDVPCRVIPDPETGTPLVVPRAHRPRVGSWDACSHVGTRE